MNSKIKVWLKIINIIVNIIGNEYLNEVYVRIRLEYI